MSVTFSVYADGKFVVPNGWVAEYEEDSEYGKVQTNQNPLELNVANGNYVRIMELLGLEVNEYYGAWGDGSLQFVADTIRFALDGLQGVEGLDGGVPPSDVSSPSGGCVIIDCGVREGYFGERLAGLLEIVTKAIEVGGEVVWG